MNCDHCGKPIIALDTAQVAVVCTSPATPGSYGTASLCGSCGTELSYFLAPELKGDLDYVTGMEAYENDLKEALQGLRDGTAGN